MATKTTIPKFDDSRVGKHYISNTDISGNMSECIFDDGVNVILQNIKTKEESWRAMVEELDYYWTELS